MKIPGSIAVLSLFVKTDQYYKTSADPKKNSGFLSAFVACEKIMNRG